MTSLPAKRFLFGTDMILTTARTGTWRHGIKVIFALFCFEIHFRFLGNFAIPESMKREYGVS